MSILRITILLLISVMILASINQIMFQVPAIVALGSTLILFFAAVTFLRLPILQKRSVFISPVLWLILYVFLQGALVAQAAGRQPWLIPYTVVEMTLLLLVMGFAYKISKGLRQLGEQVALAEVSPAFADIPTLDQVEEVVHKEITRSRHYERPLAIIAFRLNKTQADNNALDLLQNFNQNTMWQTQQAQLGQHLRYQMQSYHLLIRDSPNDLFFLVCPELNQAAAEKIGRQISETIVSQTRLAVECASASFPEDGFTFNKIRKEVLKRMTTQPAANDNAHHIGSQRLSA